MRRRAGTLASSSPSPQTKLPNPLPRTTTPVGAGEARRRAGTLASPSPSLQTKLPNPLPKTRATQASPPLSTPPPPLRDESNPRRVSRHIRDESNPRRVSRHIRDESNPRRVSRHIRDESNP